MDYLNNDTGVAALSAPELVATLLATAEGNACITCSFQAEDVVVLDLIRKHNPKIPVLFLETGYHFPATYAFRDQLTRDWNLNLINLESPTSVASQQSQFGILNQSDPARCCGIRKVEPLQRGLAGYEIWFTGLRREQSPSRANLKPVERHVLPGGKALLKVSPLAAWTWREVWQYLVTNSIPYLPLYDQGYQSIGCEPCTTLPAEGAHPRTGRWGGNKLECGIHTFTQEA